jgi:D-sedoheptulose 7-phosphate isomerase
MNASSRHEIRAALAAGLQAGAELRARMAAGNLEPIVDAALLIRAVLRNGGKLLLFGNGGSAADAQHAAAEFVGRFAREREALAAIALTTDTSILTAVANDYGFEQIFARQVRALGRPGDALIAISTSGRSPNVLQAVKAGAELGLQTIALTGEADSELARLAHIVLAVPSAHTAQVQECHMALLHALCEAAEANGPAVEQAKPAQRGQLKR